jgi:hypothetical protein
VLLKSPPTLVAAGPQGTMFSPMSMLVPADLPIRTYDAI